MIFSIGLSEKSQKLRKSTLKTGVQPKAKIIHLDEKTHYSEK